MRRYIQLNEDGLAVAELETAERFTRQGFIDVTGRVDGPWLGKIYDARTDTFSDPPARVDPRPLAEVLIYDPADVTKTEKLVWLINQQIGIQITVKDGAGNVITDFNGAFGIPIMPWNPVTLAFEGPVRRMALVFVNGVASRTFSGFALSGDYGVDDRVSDLARVSQRLIVTVME